MDPSGNTRRPVNGAALALLLLAVLLSAFLVFRSSLFTVGAIAVEGNRYLAEEEILRIAGIGGKINIFRLDANDIKLRLTQDLRIANADITRRFPNNIIIMISERQSAAYIATSYGFAQLDGEGTVLSVEKSLRQMNVPLISGHNIGGAYVGDVVEAPVVRAALVYLSSLSESVFNQLSEIHIDSSGQLTGYTMRATRIKLGGYERMAEKAAQTASILSDKQTISTTIEYIDLSYQTPYVKFKSERGEAKN